MPRPSSSDPDFVERLRRSGVTIESLRAGRPPNRTKLWTYLGAAEGARDTFGLHHAEGVLGVGAAVWAGGGVTHIGRGFRRGWGAFTDPSKCDSTDINDPEAQQQTAGACMLAGVIDNYIYSRGESIATGEVGSYAASAFRGTVAQAYAKMRALTTAAEDGEGTGEGAGESGIELTSMEMGRAAEAIAEKEVAAKVGEEAAEVAAEAAAEAETGPVGWVLMALQVTGMVLDVVDPEEYGTFLTDNNINAIVAGLAATAASDRAKVACTMLKNVFEGPLFTTVAKSGDAELCASMANLKQCMSNKYRMYPPRQHPLQDFYSTTSDPAIRASIAAYMVDYLRWTSRTAQPTGYSPPAHDPKTGLPLYADWTPRLLNAEGNVILRTPDGKPDPSKHLLTPMQNWYLRNVVGFVERRNPKVGAQMTTNMNAGLGLSLTIIALVVVVAVLLLAIGCSASWYGAAKLTRA